ncbi:phage tail protein I [Desulfobaculum bizertense]|uniref:Phage tail protein, P2 protein I family n=1 Tax=Desulfobaculum bizertense DSM 18034 TaxID=1121442 RepID=A0A1T4WXN2_9BACT|nr:phage tail protein I [Desulfobaculum bizertense]SKA81907.1 phage tail protein, P2 protein I family [Desulfobaculum bizertense DSM 18034]
MASLHLLPPNATPAERAFSEGTTRIDRIPVPIARLYNPDDCPVEFLPWLAWALSVDAWESSWSEAQKRAAVRNAIWIHKHKGTRGAVDRAVRALGYRVRIREWWQERPKTERFTFTIDIEVDDRGVSPDLYAMLTRVVLKAKNTRSHLTGFQVTESVQGGCSVGGAFQSGEELTVLPWMTHEVLQSTNLSAACAITEYLSITVQPR